MDKQSTVSKLVGFGAALAAAWIAQQVVRQGWKATRGYAPPKPEDEGDFRLGEVVAAAAITGARDPRHRGLHRPHGGGPRAGRLSRVRSGADVWEAVAV